MWHGSVSGVRQSGLFIVTWGNMFQVNGEKVLHEGSICTASFPLCIHFRSYRQKREARGSKRQYHKPWLQWGWCDLGRPTFWRAVKHHHFSFHCFEWTSFWSPPCPLEMQHREHKAIEMNGPGSFHLRAFPQGFQSSFNACLHVARGSGHPAHEDRFPALSPWLELFSPHWHFYSTICLWYSISFPRCKLHEGRGFGWSSPVTSTPGTVLRARRTT